MLKEQWHCYKIRYSNEDHEACIRKAIESNAKLILFMGHGRSDCLFGSCNKQSQDFISQDAIHENSEYYRNEYFIHSNNISRFEGRIFFSISCLSNRNDTKSLARNAINKGVITFIGFGDIPTDFIVGKNIPLKAIAIYKGIISKVLKISIYISIQNNYTVEEMVSLIKVLTIKEIQKMILSPYKNRHKETIIKNLYLFKQEIMIYGNRYERLI
ncbi:hypothetical protein [uncultured Bacteroides sp.]|uniref:hypothetical protein n=1 Tax=uncultured Bacteroides sp. TaxID=162156 RepID=UPI00261737D0|nr:hypothetical protein [uncultured Bacteroides sp.]